MKDSYKIIPSSLASLCKSFGIKDKGIFPHEFITADTICYKGPKPDIKYYKGLSKSDYDKIPDVIDIKKEAVDYMMWDCESLYTILNMFRMDIHNKYKIDVFKRDTISGIAYIIWYNLMCDNMSEIVKINKNSRVGTSIKEAYYGGVSELYCPTMGINIDDKISDNISGYAYDVNSLYPKVMVENKMPIGDILNVFNVELKDIFGFCKAEIIAPDIAAPFLPNRMAGKIILATGEWTGWYFSEELKFAETLGYKIKIIEAYQFDRSGHIFNDYVLPLYKEKSEAKDPASRNISKLLLNFLHLAIIY